VQELTHFELLDTTEFGEPFNGSLFPQHAGFNKNLGYALLQWAFEEGIKAKVFSTEMKIIGTFEQRALSLGEPGNKARSLTIDPAWVTIFLTPLGHLLVDTLRTIPEVAAGLGRGEPCYQFVERLSKHVRDFPDQRMFFEYAWFLTDDLDKSTDRFDQVKSHYLLRGYLHGLGSDFENPYCLLAAELLCMPRQCVWSIS
jgi:hypothetical protein